MAAAQPDVWLPAGIEDQLAELNMERYDEEDAEDGPSAGGRIFGGGNPGMAFYRC